MNIRSIHPFPARMAPELAIKTLENLSESSVVLDPMAGSGTVLRHAADRGHFAIGFDVDPLAVLISRVWTNPISDQSIEVLYQQVLRDALECDPLKIELPWIECDNETAAFIDFWFGKQQQRDLRRISFAIYSVKFRTNHPKEHACLDVLKVALSRIIVTKQQCASLARDTSHSRPHRVATESDYNVLEGFKKSVHFVRRRLRETPPRKACDINLGDARRINLPDNSVDLVITSPPYLNAIDYLRGHRLSLVWLGHRLSELRKIRSDSIGAERGPGTDIGSVKAVVQSMGDVNQLPSRYRGIVERYARDVVLAMGEVSRVLKPSSRAIFVIGNSCIKNIFIKNSEAITIAAELNDLRVIDRFERELPTRSRYLPLTRMGALGKRIRTESILTLEPCSIA